MSLLQTNAFDWTDFLIAIRTNGGFSGGLAQAGAQNNTVRGGLKYLQSRDRYYVPAYLSTTGNVHPIVLDPEFLNATAPNSFTAPALGITAGMNLIPAQFDAVSGAQRLFAHQ